MNKSCRANSHWDNETNGYRIRKVFFKESERGESNKHGKSHKNIPPVYHYGRLAKVYSNKVSKESQPTPRMPMNHAL